MLQFKASACPSYVDDHMTCPNLDDHKSWLCGHPNWERHLTGAYFFELTDVLTLKNFNKCKIYLFFLFKPRFTTFSHFIASSLSSLIVPIVHQV